MTPYVFVAVSIVAVGILIQIGIEMTQRRGWRFAALAVSGWVTVTALIVLAELWTLSVQGTA